MITNTDDITDDMRREIRNRMQMRLKKLRDSVANETNGNERRRIEGEMSFIEQCLAIDYLILGKYGGNKTKIALRCNRNHFIDTLHPNSLKNGNKCKQCYEEDRVQKNRGSKAAHKAKATFYELAEALKYQVIGEYINNKTKIEMECPKGHKTNTLTPNSFKKGNRCYKCWINNPERSKEDFYALAQREGYKVLEEYKTNGEKIKMQCPEGHEINTFTPNSFKSGNRCKKCYLANIVKISRNNKMARAAREAFYELANLKKYTVQGKYITASVPIKMKCPRGHETDTLTPSSFRRGHECSVCYNENRSNIMKQTSKSIDAKEAFYELAEVEGYKVLGEYVKADSGIVMKCDRGHVTETLTPSHFKEGIRCLECYEEDRAEIIRNSETFQQTKRAFYRLAKQAKYEVLGEYTIGSEPIYMRCNKNHTILNLSPSRFIAGNRCCICHNESRSELAMNTERSIDAKKAFYELAKQEGYEVLGTYRGTKQPIGMRCPQGHETETNTPGHFRNGTRCSECSHKHGELKCKKLLDFYAIEYKREQVFDGLVGVKNKPLRFDFYLPDFDTCVEIQGEWHFEDEGIYAATSTKEHDERKRDWCKKNNKTLLEIEYLTVGKGRSRLKAFEHIEAKLEEYLKAIGAI